MTDEHEADEEAIEDLEAPAEQQSDVAGGRGCRPPTTPACAEPSCVLTQSGCRHDTKDYVVWNS